MDWAYWGHVYLGLGLLLPWNAVITAADYWESPSRFPGKHMDRLFTIAYLPINAAVLMSMIHWHAKVPSGLRIGCGFTVFALATGVMPVLDAFSATEATMNLMLCLVAACGIADGAAQGALFGEAAALDPRFTQGLVVGTALSGVAVSFLRIAFKAALPETPAGLRSSAHFYFMTAALVCASCAVLHFMLPRFRGMKEARADLMRTKELFVEAMASSDSVQKNNEFSLETHHLPRSDDERITGSSSLEDEGAALVDGIEFEGELSSLHPRTKSLSYRETAWLLRKPAGSMLVLYWITLAIFPGVLAEDATSAKLGSWYPVILLTVFNVFDCIGKWIPALDMCRIENQNALLPLACVRVLFIPLFYITAMYSLGSVVMGTLAASLGLSNGLLTSSCFMIAPKVVPLAAAGLCGNIMVASLVSGLCIGAASGFLWLL